MTALPKKKKHTPEEYLALERQAKEKNEYHDGKITLRASSDENHITLTMNVACELRRKLKTKDTRVLMCDMKVRTPNSRYFFYPDVLVYQSKAEFHDEETDVLLNPKIVIEIVSKETSAFDHGDKFRIYQEFESLNEYMLIDQNRKMVERFLRRFDGIWTYEIFTDVKSEVLFSSIETKLKFDEIYELVQFEES